MDDGGSREKAAAGLPVGEVARLAGVTVRTLHHYDRIGVAPASGRTRGGYRSYTADDVARLQQVLGYRELGFGLEQIAELLVGDTDRAEQLRHQRQAIEQRIARLSHVLVTLDRTLEAMRMGMNLTPREMIEVFGDHDPTEHTDEAHERWGDTDAWQQSEQRTARYGKQEWVEIKAGAAQVDAAFAAALAAGYPADSEQARAAARAHREHVHRWFYDVSDEMHQGLAEMYLADPRFAANYERQAAGLARYVHDAIVALYRSAPA